MAKTAIEWATDVWNPTTGCDRTSPGCDHCYALTMAKRLKGMGSAKYQNDGNPTTSGPGFGLTMHPTALDAPLHWAKPKVVFVNSMSDLFHGKVESDFIARVFAVMAATPQHTYQILTKRHARMRTLLSDYGWWTRVVTYALDYADERGPTQTQPNGQCALLNVWLGVSVEDQKWADVRIPALLDTPAAVRFLSCEPLLGPVSLHRYLTVGWPTPTHWTPIEGGRWSREVGVDWVITGGESGKKARPMHPAWVRELRDQCVAAGVPFLHKQWGEWAPADHPDRPLGNAWRNEDAHRWVDRVTGQSKPFGEFTGAEQPAPALMHRVGKHTAGRELDGRTWDEYPQKVTA